jgi:hypothetical protein
MQVLSTLTLSDMTSTFRTVAMSVDFYSEIIFEIEFVDMFMIYLCTKFHVSISNGSLIIDMNRQLGKHRRIHTAAMLT